MRSVVVTYLVTALVFLGIDAVWLTAMGRIWYRPRLGHILLEQFNVAPAIAFYAIYIGGIVVFAISPAVSADRWTIATLNGALLGLVSYGTYDLTNQATIRGWSLSITLVDLGWGSLLTAVAASIGYFVSTGFGGRF